MPLIFKSRDLQPSSDGNSGASPITEQNDGSSNDPLSVALVNNMPDTALEDTESQFVELLGAAASDLRVQLTLFSIPTVPRGERAQKRLKQFYGGLAELLDSRFDGVIVTGTEPQQPDLRDEPYWNELAQVLLWAEECTHSTVLSCLAAHAGVLHSDRVLRRRLADKLFGVFAEAKVTDHPLTRSVDAPICFPHSRWNGLASEDLVACGYTVLTQASETGVGLFVKEKKNSLFVHFQGHPEYGERTLLKEYRRDVRRFLRKERETYPPLPQGYFDARTADAMNLFRENALSNRHEELIQHFPESCANGSLQKTWHPSSVAIYRNWLHFISAKTRVDHGPPAIHSARG